MRGWAALLIFPLALAGGCDRLTISPPPAASAPAAEAGPAVDLAGGPGLTYAQFVARPGMERFSLEALGLNEADRARFDAGMAMPQPGFTTSGGGTEALVFGGCAESGCAHARSIFAVDPHTGGVFVGVSGQGGALELIPNPRLEALLRVTSPSRRWDDPAGPELTAARP